MKRLKILLTFFLLIIGPNLTTLEKTNVNRYRECLSSLTSITYYSTQKLVNSKTKEDAFKALLNYNKYLNILIVDIEQENALNPLTRETNKALINDIVKFNKALSLFVFVLGNVLEKYPAEYLITELNNFSNAIALLNSITGLD